MCTLTLYSSLILILSRTLLTHIHLLPKRTVLISSLRIASVALLLTALLKPNAASSQSIHSSSRDVQSVVWGGMVLSRHLSALLSALHAGSLWVFGWLAGHATLAIVLTEPPRCAEGCCLLVDCDLQHAQA